MRHRVAHRKLGRVTEHRIAMLRNQASALLKYEHLTTTVPRAKELRPFVERLITIAKRGVAGRLRAAAERLRGGGKKDDVEGGGGSKNKATKPAKGTARRATTPRKAGGS